MHQSLPPSSRLCNPVPDENKTKQHPAKVCKMSDAASGLRDAQNQFNCAVTNHHPFGFDGDGRENEHQLSIGIHHPEGKQKTKYGA